MRRANPDLLWQARSALGCSQQELADRLNVRKATVYRWEKGRMAVGSPSRLKDTLLALLDEREREIHDVLPARLSDNCSRS